MKESTVHLFDEFATAYRCGEEPDVLEYLERAGEDADALALLVDRFLQAVPARKPSEEEVVLMQARSQAESPLLILRLRRALTRDAVVDALMRALGLDASKREKVAGYYHRLEIGSLNPKPVDQRVWSVLADTLKANAERLAAYKPQAPAVAARQTFARRRTVEASAYLASWDEGEPSAVDRTESQHAAELVDARLERKPAQPERDEVDRLFTGNG